MSEKTDFLPLSPLNPGVGNDISFGDYVKKMIDVLCQTGYFPKDDIRNLDKAVTNVVKSMQSRGLTISTAESCTGGMLGMLITSVAGASEIYGLGAVTYADFAKREILGVKPETLECFGAVSAQTAVEMAAGIRRRAASDIGVSVTGIAGPSGAVPGKPVGTVYVGFSSEKYEFSCLLRLFELENANREIIRKNTALCVFELLERLICTESRQD